jgi:hypothetical protein
VEREQFDPVVAKLSERLGVAHPQNWTSTYARGKAFARERPPQWVHFCGLTHLRGRVARTRPRRRRRRGSRRVPARRRWSANGRVIVRAYTSLWWRRVRSTRRHVALWSAGSPRHLCRKSSSSERAVFSEVTATGRQQLSLSRHPGARSEQQSPRANGRIRALSSPVGRRAAWSRPGWQPPI